ncbi:hypothetical protein M8756_15300 [Lutimaribacter sp. EGI FJ00015]|uniref:Uncharacterized protein n=1 Tax=Lutimaribacter degradans TaxID=2945989 RepID=A0ACC5ZZI5_9RHOB|nr:hypothetical protein [Lutimaribacter sp. EGI FJ00013]MCM2563506.1 hypothetical protein [Lutimaribacter sp. EGI FJ00013]MCO0614686.1 hypothetical protein [Lutimaribacter sp. EGI FJ00015]MCO0637356.1 hypothetical protein [Lutimaribacter sp. EGI FJ00014]
MVIFLKFLHFAALALALGGGVANIVLGRQLATAEGAAKPVVTAAQRTLARVSALSLLVLWVTGIGLVYAYYGGWSGFGTAFWGKIAVAAILTVNMGVAQHLMSHARKSGTPPPKAVRAMGLAGPVLLLVIVALATMAFSY